MNREDESCGGTLRLGQEVIGSDLPVSGLNNELESIPIGFAVTVPPASHGRAIPTDHCCEGRIGKLVFGEVSFQGHEPDSALHAQCVSSTLGVPRRRLFREADQNVCMAKASDSKHKRGKTFLRAWRKFKDLTQEEAASRLDIDRTTLGRIERGLIPYDQDFLEKLSLAYGCDVADLLTVDPLKADPPRLVWEQLQKASPEVRERALKVLDALLKAG